MKSSVEKWSKASEAPGMSRGRLAGSWIYDLVALGKAILLCDFCAHKFDSVRAGYGTAQILAGHRYVLSTCDGCRRHGQCSMFLKES